MEQLTNVEVKHLEELIDRGLNLSRLDEWTAEEARAFHDHYVENLGLAPRAYEFWAEHRPGVLKRHRLQAMHARQDAPWFPLLFLHYYTVIAYEDGIGYEIESARKNGYTREQVLDTLELAFLHCGPRGIHYAERISGEKLRNYDELEPRSALFPTGWSVDPGAFDCGLDPSTPALLPGERERILAWYETTAGEVPPYASFLAELHPRLLKIHRIRLEHVASGALPKQLIALLQLHLNVSRGFEDGIREWLLLARSFGTDRADVVSIVSWGMLYGGPAAVSIAARAAAGVLPEW